MAAALVGAMTLAACGSNDSSSSGSGSGGLRGPQSNLKVGLAYDIGGRGDKSFNDSAAAGLDKAKKDFGIRRQRQGAVGPVRRDRHRPGERLELLAKPGYNPVIAVGFAYAPALKHGRARSTRTCKFAHRRRRRRRRAATSTNLTFAEEQGSFLVGAAAGAEDQDRHGRLHRRRADVPLIQKFEAGYEAGAKAAKPDIKVARPSTSTQPPDFTGFNDPAKGKAAAKGMYDGGADVVYARRRRLRHRACSRPRRQGRSKLAIGVDSDQYLTRRRRRCRSTSS